MGIDTPGPPDGGDGPEGPRRPGWDRPPGESALAIETRQPFGSRAAHRAKLAAAMDDVPRRADRQPENRADAIRDIITDENGNYLGVEGRRKDIRVVSGDQLSAMQDEMRRRLGEPDAVVESPKGKVEVWVIEANPRATVAYRSFSQSGGAALDLNGVPGLDEVTRFHIDEPHDGRAG